MLIPIFKPGDVLVGKTPTCDGKVLVLDSKIKSETTEYTTDMDFGCGVTRHEIKTSEWVEYSVINSGFIFIRIEEDALCRWYRRINHVDLPCNSIEADSGEKDEEIRNAKEAIELYKDQLKDRRKDIRVLQDRVEEDKDNHVKLIAENEKLAEKNNELKESCAKYKEDIFSLQSYIEKLRQSIMMHDKIASEAKIYRLNKEIEDLNNQLKMAYGCIDRFTIDAVAGMRRAGCSVEKIAKTLNMPEQAVRVYLNAADVLDCKEDE